MTHTAWHELRLRERDGVLIDENGVVASRDWPSFADISDANQYLFNNGIRANVAGWEHDSETIGE